MAAKSDGKAIRLKKRSGKGGDVAQKNYRFESFNERISKLKIDPIRRNRDQIGDEKDSGTALSNFKNGIAHWKELNLSQTFASFVREMEPLCDSLPQILLYQNRIFDTLMQYIDKRDRLSLEPLLSLLSHLAHDLGIRFEPHFPKALSTVATVAAQHHDVEVIEWAFSCIAWLFKYQSKLLVANIWPTWCIIAPLLGKEAKKEHLARFAAQALSFLIRKAALLYLQDQAPLTNLVTQILQDLHVGVSENHDSVLYNYGVLTVFSEAVKGVDGGFHSCAVNVLRCLLNHAEQPQGPEIILGTVTSMIHHGNETSFVPILDLILEYVSTLEDTRPRSIQLAAELIFCVSSVRKGSRIVYWQPVVATLPGLFRAHPQSSSLTEKNEMLAFEKAAALVFSSASVGALSPHLKATMEALLNERSTQSFYSFCAILNHLNHDRFNELVAPYFFKHFHLHWDKQESSLLAILPSFADANLPLALKGCPKDWQVRIVESFRGSSTSPERIYWQSAYLDLLGVLSLDEHSKSRILESLSSRLNLLTGSPNDIAQCSMEPEIKLLLGIALHEVLDHSGSSRQLPKLNQLLSAFASFTTWPFFLRNVEDYVKRYPTISNQPPPDVFLNNVISNLSNPSRRLRKLSLALLERFYHGQWGGEADALKNAISIENLPLEAQSARQGSMLIRRLSEQYKACSMHPWLGQAIAHFCFGILTLKLSPWWDEAIEVLKVICENADGEVLVTAIVFDWFDTKPTTQGSPRIASISRSSPQNLTEFQSSDARKVEETVKFHANEVQNADQVLKERFELRHAIPTEEWSAFRAQALRVLSALPRLAEKKSCLLVPAFLRWANPKACNAVLAGPDENKNSSSLLEDATSSGLDQWSHQDTKALLDLFGSFLNPCVLYRSSDVYQSLLHCLTRGDTEVQRSAFQAIMTWKSDALGRYEQNITNIIDEARFRDEITTLLFASVDDNVLQPEHFHDVMPVLLRILFGKTVTRSKSSENSVRRKAVFDAIHRLPDIHIREFIDIALGPLRCLGYSDSSLWHDVRLQSSSTISPRMILGLLNLFKDLIMSMGNRLEFFGQTIFGATLLCSVHASRRLVTTDVTDAGKKQEALLKDVRQTGLQCIAIGFKHFEVDDLEHFMPIVFKELIDPRLQQLPVENAHSISAFLKLFAVWSSSARTAFFLADYSPSLVPAIAAILNVTSAKDEVQKFVLEQILSPIALLASSEVEQESLDLNVSSRVLGPNMDQILQEVGTLLGGNPSVPVLASALELVTLLSGLTNTSAQSMRLLQVSRILIDQPPRRVSPRSKGKLLKIINRFLSLAGIGSEDDLLWQLYHSTSSLFGYFLDRDNRALLCETMHTVATIDGTLSQTAQMCSDLNSYSPHTVDEPDFERRIQAFNSIAASSSIFNEEQWRPLLFNCLFYIKDDEIPLRASASSVLHTFVDSTTAQPSSEGEPRSELITKTMLGEIRSGASDASETLRAEMLSIMAHVIRKYPEWREVNDMRPLLMDGDDEASVFNNIFHIQRHRRFRALRRLATEAEAHRLGSKNITAFWIPMLEPFLLEKVTGETDHNLASESIATIAVLATGIQWSQLKLMLQRYTGYIRSKPLFGKPLMKMLATLTDTLAKVASWMLPVPGQTHVNGVSARPLQLGTLSASLPDVDKFSLEVERVLLLPLLSNLHEKDESTIVLRTTAAVTLVKLLKTLKPEKLEEYLPPVLTDLSHILRSRAQESRDITRTSLAEVSRLIGAERFAFVLKELRGSLQRGYQLHVLSFTVHSILVATASEFGPGDLDNCLPQLVAVIIDDIFGMVGQEKDAEEYVSKMKEVKSSKSFDSMELVARVASVNQISQLVRPLQHQLEQKMDVKLIRKVDELLRRLGVGLLQNKSINSQASLVFCYEILQHAHGTTTSAPGPDSRKGTNRFLVRSERSNKGVSQQRRSVHTYKLARFALDLLRTILQRYVELRTPANLSGFLPVVGEFLIEAQEEVQISALRLLVEIVKAPFKDIRSNAGVYLVEAVKVIKNAFSTNAEIAQAALKLITTILRERHDVTMREVDLAYLIKRIKDDLEEPDRQGVTFNFLKAVLHRKVVIAEVYEVMDSVATIMITSQAENSRNTARSLYFQFLLNYPQARTRLSKQFAFLVKNLEYKHVEGRQSVMEATYLLVGKVGPDVIQDMIGTFFLPLVMVTVNDESLECRKMAGSLLKSLFEQADEDKSRQLLNLLREWLYQDQPLMLQMALHVHRILLDAESKGIRKHVPLLRDRISRIIRPSSAEKKAPDWESVYYSLEVLAKLCQIDRARSFDASQSEIWSSVQDCMKYPHAWVKVTASQLLGQYFADLAKTNTNPEDLTFPMRGSHGLMFRTEDLRQLTRTLFAALQVHGISEELAAQVSTNLLFLGRFSGKEKMEPVLQEPDVDTEAEASSDSEAQNDTGDRKPRRTVLQYIFSRISYILRREPVTTRAASLIPKTAALQILAELCNHLPVSQLAPCVLTILLSLHHLTDPSIPVPFSTDEGFKETQKAITSKAQENMTLLQTKLGTMDYVQGLAKVRERVKERREGRRTKRHVEAMTEPERLGRVKRRKEERKKEKRREKVNGLREWRRTRR